MAADHHILQGRHPGKHLDILKGPGQAQGRHLMRLPALQIMAVKANPAGGGGKRARNQIEERGLAGPVGPDHRLDQPLLHPKGDIIHRLQAAELFMEMFDFKKGHAQFPRLRNTDLSLSIIPIFRMPSGAKSMIRIRIAPKTASS